MTNIALMNDLNWKWWNIARTEPQANEFDILFELEAQKLKELLHDYRNYLLGIQQLSVM